METNSFCISLSLSLSIAHTCVPRVQAGSAEGAICYNEENGARPAQCSHLFTGTIFSFRKQFVAR